MEIFGWNTSASSNNAPPPEGAPDEGITFGDISDLFREVMAVCARWRKDVSGEIVSSSFVSGTYGVQLARNTITSPYDGLRFTFFASDTNTGATKVAINGGTAYPLYKRGSVELGAGDLPTGTPVDVVFRTNAFHLLGNGALATDITAAKEAMRLPVGTIVILDVATDPATLYGYGTWSQVAQGRVLIGEGTGTDANGTPLNFTLGATGGEYTHTLSLGEIPAHVHDFSHNHYIDHNHNIDHTHNYLDYELYAPGGGPVDGGSNIGAHDVGRVTSGPSTLYSGTSSAPYSSTHVGNTGWMGGGLAHTNIQPFQAVKYWKRTA